MDLRKLGLLAACLSLPVSAFDRGAIPPRWAPARQTDRAEQAERSATGISPVPTSKPDLAAVELFKRDDDYTLPTDYCGWYGDYKSASYTCGRVGASCINIGSFRGCCYGAQSSCSSTIYSTCIDSSSLSQTTTCQSGTICCTGSDYPACGTILFSSSANPSDTFTIVDCFSSGFGTTYQMQDFPPATATSTTSQSSGTTEPSATASGPPRETGTASKKSSTPVGPIVGGVVGGIAVIGLIILGVLYLYRWRPGASKSPATNAFTTGAPPADPSYPQDPSMHYQQQQPQQQMGQMNQHGSQYYASSVAPSTYDPRYSYAPAGVYPAGSPTASTYPSSPPFNSSTSPSMGGPMSTPSPDPNKVPGGVSPASGQPLMEAPARNPVGMGNNAAELA